MAAAATMFTSVAERGPVSAAEKMPMPIAELMLVATAAAVLSGTAAAVPRAEAAGRGSHPANISCCRVPAPTAAARSR